MRISELSRESGVPVPTIKFYLREGLLAGGEPSAPNQARYDESHVRRLALIRSLVDVGGLAIADVRTVLGVIDSPERSIHQVLGATVHAITGSTTSEDTAEHAGENEDDARRRANRAMDDLVARHEWDVDDNPSRTIAAGVLARLDRLGHHQIFGALDSYARAAELIAETDLATVVAVQGRAARAETALVGTVLGDVLLAALRRLAQQHTSAKQFPPPTE